MGTRRASPLFWIFWVEIGGSNSGGRRAAKFWVEVVVISIGVLLEEGMLDRLVGLRFHFWV